MRVEKVFYSRSQPLSATLELPEYESSQKLPCVVLCHGHSRHKDDGLDLLAKMLCEAGFATMRFCFRGCGSHASNRYQLYCATDWPEDLTNAISYLKSIPVIDSDRIGVCGISMGASTVVYTGGIDHRIKSIAAMAGISDCYQWLKGVWQQNGGCFETFLELLEEDSVTASVTGTSGIIPSLDMYHKGIEEKTALLEEVFENSEVNSFVSKGALRNLLSYRPIEKCASITQPIFFLHGELDDIVPIEESVKMYEAVRSEQKQWKKYPGIEHNMPMDEKREVVFTDIVTWFHNTLHENKHI